MANTFLHQQSDQPLFGDIIWNKPEQRSLGGKLGIIGGNSQGFSSVASAYSAAESAGAGVIRVLFPDSLRKTLKKVWPSGEFASSTKNGSLGSKALIELTELEKWADYLLISGNLGQNSETAILLEHFVNQTKKPLTVCGDGVSILTQTPIVLINKDITLAVDLNQLSHLLKAIRYPMSVRSDMNIFQMADLLHSLTQSYPWSVIIIHLDNAFTGYQGEVSLTPINDFTIIQVATAATVWRMQQPIKPFEAMTSGIYSLVS